MRGTPVQITVDGRTVDAFDGEMLAAVLWADGMRAVRTSAVSEESRGPFCFMGVCQDCLVTINGRIEQSCLVAIREGLSVELMASHG